MLSKMCIRKVKIQCYQLKYCYKCIKSRLITSILHFLIISHLVADKQLCLNYGWKIPEFHIEVYLNNK